jgi:hypothetical protein
MVAFAAIVVGMITITFVALRQTANRTGQSVARPSPATSLGTSVAGSATAIPAVTDELTAPAAGFAINPAVLARLRPGDCLDWTPIAAGVPASTGRVVPVQVSCRDPHIDEITRMVDLSMTFDRWPGATALTDVAKERCDGALRAFAGAIDTAPHRVVGMVYPSETSWQSGARSVACTVRSDDLRPRRGPLRGIGSVGA